MAQCHGGNERFSALEESGPTFLRFPLQQLPNVWQVLGVGGLTHMAIGQTDVGQNAVFQISPAVRILHITLMHVARGWHAWGCVVIPVLLHEHTL